MTDSDAHRWIATDRLRALPRGPMPKRERWQGQRETPVDANPLRGEPPYPPYLTAPAWRLA